MVNETLKEFFIKVNFDTSGFDKLKDSLSNLSENLKGKFNGIFTNTNLNIKASANEIKSDLKSINETAKTSTEQTAQSIINNSKNMQENLKSNLENLKQSFKSFSFDTIKDKFKNLNENLKQEAKNLQNSFNAPLQKIKDKFKNMFANLKKQTQGFSNDTKRILGGLSRILGTYFSFAFLKNSIGDFVNRGMLADEASSLLGITPERFDNIAHAFNRFGVEATSMESQLSSVNKQIQQAEKGTGRLKIVLEKFGLTIKNANGEVMSADEFLLSMSEQLKDFGGKTRGAILAMMGFDNSIQSAFSDGGEALMSFYKKQKELNIITEKDTKLAKKWTFQLKDLKDQMDRIRNAIARFLLPIVTKIAEMITKFIEWIFKHKQAFTAILITIALLLAPILKTLTLIVARTALLLAPWIALGALIAGIILVFEDIYYYFKGYKSITGEFVKKWQFLATFLDIFKPLIMGIGTALEDIIKFFKEPNFDNFTAIFENIFRAIINQFQKIGDIFINGFKEIYDNWKNIDWLETFNNLFKIDWWNEKLNEVKKWFIDTFNLIVDFIKNIFNGVFDFITEKIKNIIEPITKIKDKISGGVVNVKAKITGAIENAKDFLSFGNNAPVATANNYATTNNTSNQQIHINAYGVTNENADKLGKSVGNQVNSAIYQNGNTGRF